MAKFERLIVYPLLFIALFCSMTGLPVLKAAGGGEGNGDAHNFLRLFQSNPEGGNSNEEKVVVDEVRVKRIIAEEIVVGKPVDGSALEQYVRIGTDESGTMVFENVEGDGRFLIEPSGYTLYNEDMVSASLWYSPWFGTSLRICHNNGEDGITLASGDLYEGSELKISGNDRHAFLGTKPSKSFLVLTGPENTPLTYLGDTGDGKSSQLRISGNNREAIFGTTQENSFLVLAGPKDKPVIAMGDAGYGGSLVTFNRYGDPLVSISVTDEGQHGGIWVHDRYGESAQFYGHDRD